MSWISEDARATLLVCHPFPGCKARALSIKEELLERLETGKGQLDKWLKQAIMEKLIIKTATGHYQAANQIQARL